MKFGKLLGKLIPDMTPNIVKRYATTDRMQQQVKFAAKRSLELLDLALFASTQAVVVPLKGR